MSTAKKVYKIPCLWQMWGVMEIEADSLEKAKRIAIDDAPLPTDGDFVDGSFELDEESDLFGEIKEVILPKRIKIAKSTDPDSWYANKIGETFEVIGIGKDAKDHFQVKYFGEDYNEEYLISKYGNLDNPAIPMELLPVEHEVFINDCEVVE